MVNFSTANAQAPFDMTDGDLVSYSSLGINASTHWSWITGNGDAVHVYGTSFTYSGTHATGGTVTSVSVDVDNDQSASPELADIYLTGLSGIDITRLDDGAQAFWDELLQDGDNVDLLGMTGLDTDTTRVFGDDLGTLAAAFFGVHDNGGDDVISGGESPLEVSGDVWNVVGYDFGGLAHFTSYTGGDDLITSSSAPFSNRYMKVAGDAKVVGIYATLTGGNDTIKLSENATPLAYAVGDVETQNGGTVIGGNDIIEGSSYTGNNGNEAIGDVFYMTGGTLTGGDDMISAGLGGRALLVGDAYLVDTGLAVVGGNDVLHGGAGDDDIYGDVAFVNGAGLISLTPGDDVLIGGAGDDKLYGDTGFDFPGLFGGNDRLFGGVGNDFIKGGSGDDFLNGGAGDDFIDGGTGVDWVSYADDFGVNVDLSIVGAQQSTFGAGQDTLINIENLLGSAGDDVLKGDGLGNLIEGGLGNDELHGGAGGDQLSGGFGDDKLFGGADSDFLEGGLGDDRLQGGGSTNILHGGSGQDWVDYTLYGASDHLIISLRTTSFQATAQGGSDQLWSIDNIDSGDGNDNLKGTNLGNFINGNGGVDVINGFAGNDTLRGGDGNDKLFGSDGLDIIDGGADNDTVHGNSGNDTLSGGDGNDYIYGDAGDDIVGGDGGDDVVRGGTGADKFVFRAYSGIDRVRDFADGSDLIDLSSYNFADKATAMGFASQTTWGAVKFDMSFAPFGQAGDLLYVEGMTLNTNFTEVDILI